MISVVVPTCNMAPYLPELWESMLSSGLAGAVDEVLIVNDGSTDETLAVIDGLKRGPSPECSKLRLLDLPKNEGRFTARYLGAQAALGDSVLFLDTRLTLAKDFGPALKRLAPLHASIVGSVDIDVKRSVFSLYWDRSHRAIFRRHFRAAVRPIVLTPRNFDQYLKGTGVFLCRKEDFVAACRKFEGKPLFSDDTYLMKEMVESEPIVVHPDLRVSWVPREEWRGFVWRIWNRGPQFVEYHVFQRRGAFFWVIMAGLAGIAALATTLILDWKLGLALLGALCALGILSVLAFTRKPSEAMRLAPLHFAILLAFGLGTLRGIWINAFRSLGFYKGLRY